MSRKIIQLTSTWEPNAYVHLFAVCDDGTVWWNMGHSLTEFDHWEQVPDVPQEENTKETNQ